MRSSKNLLFFSLFSCTITLCISLLYYNFFSVELNSFGENIEKNGFQSIIIPDTILYYSTIDFQNVIQSIFLSAVKNTIGPSFIWYISNGNWEYTILINGILLFLTSRYIIFLSQKLKIKQSKTLVSLLILIIQPNTIFYMIGALKEIPSMFLLTGFVYYFLERKYIKLFFFMILLVTFRTQLVFPLVFVLILRFLSIKKSTKMSLCIMILISAFYPILKELTIFANGAADVYREIESGSGLGQKIEYIRSNVPVLSILAILIRIFQTITEPVFIFFKISENGNFQIFRFVMVSSFFLMGYYFIHCLKNIYLSLKHKIIVNPDIAWILAIIILIGFPTAGFSFIQYRYLYPLFPLILISANCNFNNFKKI